MKYIKIKSRQNCFWGRRNLHTKKKRELQESSDRLKQINQTRISINRKLDESEQDAMNVMDDLAKRNYRNISDEDLTPGSMLLFQNYDAKDKTSAYDKTPLVIVLGSHHTSKYILRVKYSLATKSY